MLATSRTVRSIAPRSTSLQRVVGPGVAVALRQDQPVARLGPAGEEGLLAGVPGGRAVHDAALGLGHGADQVVELGDRREEFAGVERQLERRQEHAIGQRAELAPPEAERASIAAGLLSPVCRADSERQRQVRLESRPVHRWCPCLAAVRAPPGSHSCAARSGWPWPPSRPSSPWGSRWSSSRARPRASRRIRAPWSVPSRGSAASRAPDRLRDSSRPPIPPSRP
jgi:hypothetical protein